MAKPKIVQQQARETANSIRLARAPEIGVPDAKFAKKAVKALGAVESHVSIYGAVERVVEEGVAENIGIDQMIRLLRKDSEVQVAFKKTVDRAIQDVFPRPEKPDFRGTGTCLKKVVCAVAEFFLVPNESTTLHAALENLKSSLNPQEIPGIANLFATEQFSKFVFNCFSTLMERMVHHAFSKMMANPDTARRYFSHFANQLQRASAWHSHEPYALLKGYCDMYVDAMRHGVDPDMIDEFIAHAKTNGVEKVSGVVNQKVAKTVSFIPRQDEHRQRAAAELQRQNDERDSLLLGVSEALRDKGVMERGSFYALLTPLIENAEREPDVVNDMRTALFRDYFHFVKTEALDKEFIEGHRMEQHRSMKDGWTNTYRGY